MSEKQERGVVPEAAMTDHERKARDLCRTLRIWRSRRVPTYDPDDPFDTVIEIRPEVMNVLAQALADAEADGRRKAFEECVVALTQLVADTGSEHERHCPTCICGKRAPVRADRSLGKGPGTIAWSEHLLAWSAYAAKYGDDQSAERLAERCGFSYGELVDFLGREPTTWEPRR